MSEYQVKEDIQKGVEKATEELDEKATEAQKNAEDTANSVTEDAKDFISSSVDAAKNAVHAVDDAVVNVAGAFSEKAKEFVSDAKADIEKAAEKAVGSEDFSEKVAEELKDPAVSTTVLFTAVTASAASTYLAQQHKQGKLTALITTGVVAGVAALSVAEYFSVKAYFKRNTSS